jgi:hypothetical protein
MAPLEGESARLTWLVVRSQPAAHAAFRSVSRQLDVFRLWAGPIRLTHHDDDLPATLTPDRRDHFTRSCERG